MDALPVVDLTPSATIRPAPKGSLSLRNSAEQPTRSVSSISAATASTPTSTRRCSGRHGSSSICRRPTARPRHRALPAFRGYTILGDEVTDGRSDWRDQLDLGPEQPPPEHGPDDPPWKRLRGPNQWPAALPTMAPTVLRWMAAMDGVGITALRALAVGLGLPMDHFDRGFLPESDVHLKIIRYPSSTTDTGDSQGVGLHSDTGLLTFILQDEVGGLQVQIGGEMIDAPAVPACT